MKRISKCFVIFIVLLSMCGCGRKQRDKVRVVTAVQVTISDDNNMTLRQYTKPQNIQKVLNYLRLQENLGAAEEDPERLTGTAFVIDVMLSDGSHSVYYQRGGRYLSKEYHSWQKIDRERAMDFNRMLQQTPTDT